MELKSEVGPCEVLFFRSCWSRRSPPAARALAAETRTTRPAGSAARAAPRRRARARRALAAEARPCSLPAAAPAGRTTTFRRRRSSTRPRRRTRPACSRTPWAATPAARAWSSPSRDALFPRQLAPAALPLDRPPRREPLRAPPPRGRPDPRPRRLHGGRRSWTMPKAMWDELAHHVVDDADDDHRSAAARSTATNFTAGARPASPGR